MKKKVFEIDYFGSKFVSEELEPMIIELEEMDIGETATISRIEMEEKDLENLPEFDGF